MASKGWLIDSIGCIIVCISRNRTCSQFGTIFFHGRRAAVHHFAVHLSGTVQYTHTIYRNIPTITSEPKKAHRFCRTVTSPFRDSCPPHAGTAKNNFPLGIVTSPLAKPSVSTQNRHVSDMTLRPPAANIDCWVSHTWYAITGYPVKTNSGCADQYLFPTASYSDSEGFWYLSPLLSWLARDKRPALQTANARRRQHVKK